IAMLWNHLIIQARPPCPLILVGAGWRTFFTTFIQDQQDHLSKQITDLVTCVDSIDEAVAVLHPNPNNQDQHS
ncbi:MAG: hypothetical protein HPY76_04195, partial [Anaerolineae bacterium]|nr:hypothetical protein [Anaerolineae bacterium]